MELGLTDKVALITGASQGIGLAIARQLAREGMKVAVAARNGDRLLAFVAEVESAGGSALAYPADLRDPETPAAFVAAALERFRRIDAVVNNAGSTRRGDFLTLTEIDWSDGYALKFFGAVRLCRAAWPHLMAGRGSIVNIAGVGGRTGSAEFTIGGSVNAALLNLTKCLADRGVQDGVRANAVNPGYIVTDRLAGRIQRLATETGSTPDEAKKMMAEKTGIARFGEPAEIADTVAFLVSDRAAYLQGAIIDVDGGMTRTL